MNASTDIFYFIIYRDRDAESHTRMKLLISNAYPEHSAGASVVFETFKSSVAWVADAVVF